ncbi:Mechanosensitive ion channel protein 8 [Linum grandiflorum]
MEALRRSFKSHLSNKHIHRLSAAADKEHLIPILRQSSDEMNNDNADKEIPRNRREPSFGFSSQMADEELEDPPTRLIHQFLNQQKSGEIALDMDLEMNELKVLDEMPQPSRRSSIRVSFDPSVSDTRSDAAAAAAAAAAADSLRRRHNNPSPTSAEAVIRCTSNSSFRKEASSLSRLKTKSRLLDPPEDRIERMSGMIAKSGQLRRSGMLSKSGDQDEDDDDLELEDLPEEFNSTKMNISTILQWVVLVAIIVSLICSLVIPSLEKHTIAHLRLWKWEVLLLNCLWLGLVLAAWLILFDKRVEQEAKGRVKDLKYLTKVLICFLVANFIWLLKTLLVKVLASSFHVSTYFDRIQESLFNQYVIETLSGPPLIEQLRIQDDVERTANEVAVLQSAGPQHPPPASSGKSSIGGKSFKNTSSVKAEKNKNGGGDNVSDSKKHTITIDHLHQLNTKNVSAWNMKRLIKIVRHGSLSTLDEQILQGANQYADDQSRKIRSEYEAKAAARKIFYNVAGHNARERRALALTLNDTKTAVNKLHQMVNVIVSVIIVIISLLLLDIAPSRLFVLLGSQIVVVSFIFGNTCKTLFESIIFLFIVHPYDVGDRCEIGADGIQKVVYHNNILATKSIGNYYRSPDMGDAIEFLIHVTTPPDKVTIMKQRIISYIEAKKEHWYPSPMVITKDVEGLHSIRMAVWFRHRINHQDMGEKFTRRATLVEEIIKIFKELDIQYRFYPIDVNIRQVPPLPPLPYSN